VLLLDEPSLGLAATVATQIMDRLRWLRDTTGLAVLIVEPDERRVLSIADTTVSMASGRLVWSRSRDSHDQLISDHHAEP
jgi:branched-chain amino acid transport system ATP-binding protein